MQCALILIKLQYFDAAFSLIIRWASLPKGIGILLAQWLFDYCVQLDYEVFIFLLQLQNAH